jgi:hypothetical protein
LPKTVREENTVTKRWNSKPDENMREREREDSGSGYSGWVAELLYSDVS